MGFLASLFQLAQAHPRVFTEKADAGIKGGAAPAFQRPVANVVERGANRQHVIKSQAGGKQGLVGVGRTTSVIARVMDLSKIKR
jgi:hypothetical protein